MADPTLIEQVVEQFQRDRSEWFSAPVREILGEYETWRSGLGSAALPSEAIERVERAGQALLYLAANGRPGMIADEVREWKDAIAAVRATTPTAPDDEAAFERECFEAAAAKIRKGRAAPVQDDDAE